MSTENKISNEELDSTSRRTES